MDFIEKIKHRLANFDLNSFLAGLTATVGAAVTNDFVQLLYATVAIVANLWTLTLSYRRSKIQIDIEGENHAMRAQEVEMKRIEVETARFELEEKRRAHNKPK